MTAAAAAVVAVITATLMFIFRGKIKLLASNVFGRKGESKEDNDDDDDDEQCHEYARSKHSKIEDGKEKRGKTTSFEVGVGAKNEREKDNILNETKVQNENENG